MDTDHLLRAAALLVAGYCLGRLRASVGHQRRDRERYARGFDRGFSAGHDRLVVELRRLVASGAAHDLLRGIGRVRWAARMRDLEQTPAEGPAVE